MDEENTLDELRHAHEELARRVVSERLGFSDRVQEVLDIVDGLQAAIDDRDAQIRNLTTDAEALRNRVESLHTELLAAHKINEELERSRSYRYTAPFRRVRAALRRS